MAEIDIIDSETILKTELQAARQKWTEAILTADVDRLMQLYAPNASLKPTLADDFRTTPEGIRAYFEGTAEKPGFAKAGWETAQFGSPALIQPSPDGNMVVVMSKCYFQKGEVTVTADKTIVYVRQNHQWLIQAHHSSLEYTGQH